LSNIGTTRWCAPELLSGQEYDTSVDIFSFGIVLWEIWCRKLPFNTYSFDYEAADAIRRGERPPVPSDCSSCYYELMKQCWSHNKGQRPDFALVEESLKQLIRNPTV
jgi:serine/threonine protein kinase